MKKKKPKPIELHTHISNEYSERTSKGNLTSRTVGPFGEKKRTDSFCVLLMTRDGSNFDFLGSVNGLRADRPAVLVKCQNGCS
jgi:hypothetical protein